MCSLVYSGGTLQDCLSFNDGILTKGLKNAIYALYYHSLSEWIVFKSTPEAKRTKDFLSKHEFSEETLNYIYMMYLFLERVMNQNETLIADQIKNHLQGLLNLFIAIFCLFMVFLLFSLVFALKVVIENLKTVVFRSRILTKIIPMDELQELKKRENKQHQQHRHSSRRD